MKFIQALILLSLSVTEAIDVEKYLEELSDEEIQETSKINDKPFHSMSRTVKNICTTSYEKCANPEDCCTTVERSGSIFYCDGRPCMVSDSESDDEGDNYSAEFDELESFEEEFDELESEEEESEEEVPRSIKKYCSNNEICANFEECCTAFQIVDNVLYCDGEVVEECDLGYETSSTSLSYSENEDEEDNYLEEAEYEEAEYQEEELIAAEIHKSSHSINRHCSGSEICAKPEECCSTWEIRSNLLFCEGEFVEECDLGDEPFFVSDSESDDEEDGFSEEVEIEEVEIEEEDESETDEGSHSVHKHCTSYEKCVKPKECCDTWEIIDNLYYCDGLFLEECDVVGETIESDNGNNASSEDFVSDSIGDAISDSVATYIEENIKCEDHGKRSAQLNDCYLHNLEECFNCMDNHPIINIISNSIKEEMEEEICPQLEGFFKYCGCDTCEVQKAAAYECYCGGSDDNKNTSESEEGELSSIDFENSSDNTPDDEEDFVGHIIGDAISDSVATLIEEHKECEDRGSKSAKLNACFRNNVEECTNCLENHPRINSDNFKLNSIKDEMEEEICPELKEFYRYCGCDMCKDEKEAVHECYCGSGDDNDTSGSPQGNLAYWTSLFVTAQVLLTLSII